MEDPSHDFKPATGTISRCEIPSGRVPGKLRIDARVRTGDAMFLHYDSSVAKVMGWVDTRPRAIENTRIKDIATTIPVLLAVSSSRGPESGAYDTRAIPGWPAR